MSIKQGMYWLVDKNVARGPEEPNSVFPLGAKSGYSLIQCLQQLCRAEGPRTRMCWISRKTQELQQIGQSIRSQEGWGRDLCRGRLRGESVSRGKRVAGQVGHWLINQYIAIEQISKHRKGNGRQFSLCFLSNGRTGSSITPTAMSLPGRVGPGFWILFSMAPWRNGWL